MDIRTMKNLFLFVVLFFTLVSADYDLTILHTGDVRCHFEEFNLEYDACTIEDKERNECFGGWARLDTLINGYRAMKDNLLVLDVGNQFHGTLWFNVYRDEATSYFMNRTGYDAMALGHHEFNLKPSGLEPFLLDANFPVLSCNIDDSKEPIIQDKYNKYDVVVVGGKRIGIIGFTLWNTAEISNAGELVFHDEVEYIKIAAQELQNIGVDIIIALGRSTFDINMNIAKEVPGIDIVVGGDLNQFQYTGKPPSYEEPTARYPVVVQPNGDTDTNVLVVQAHHYLKYVGHLDVTFDDDGNIKEWGGNPVILDKDVAEDPDTLQEINEWAEKVHEYEDEHIGETNVLLEGTGPNNRHKDSPCRFGECSMGNLVADAFVQQSLNQPTEDHWNDASIAFVNAGGLRHTFEIGDIDKGDVLTLLPYSSSVDSLDLKGQHFMEVLEHAVAGYNASNPVDLSKFLQFSGVRVVYDLSRTDGERVQSASVLCTECQIPQFEALDSEKTYRVITSNFLAEGGDNFDMIVRHKENHVTGEPDTTFVEAYIRQMSPLYHHGQTGRIRFVGDTSLPCAYGDAISRYLANNNVVFFGAMISVLLNCYLDTII